MADDIARLGLEVDSKDIRRAIHELDRMERQAGQTERATDSMGVSARKAAVAIGAMAAAAAAVGAASKIIDVARQFDVINASLVTVTGSAEGADRAFERIQDFASTTPFALSEVANAFVKLKALGLDPSERALQSYGNTASAMGKDINQMIEAVADATTGEFERLKEFGIKAKSEGDNVSLTFRGVTKTIRKEASSIQEYLLSLGEVEFAGAMEERANSLDGALSNLGDTWDKLFLTISQSGLGDEFERLARYLTEALEGLTMFIAGQSEEEIAMSALREQIIQQNIVLADMIKLHGRDSEIVAHKREAVARLKDEYANLAAAQKKSNEEADKSIAGAGAGAATPSVEEDKLSLFMAERNARNIEQMQKYYSDLREMAIQASLDEEQQANLDYERTLEQIEKDRALLEEQGLLDAELKAELHQAEQDAEFLHQETINQIKQDAYEKDLKNKSDWQKLMLAIDKGAYGDALQMAGTFADSLIALGGANFEKNKKVQIAIAGVKGLGTIMNAIEHGSQTGGVFGAITEGAIATAMVGAQIAKISSASLGGGASIGGVSGGGASAISSAPATPVPITEQPQQQQGTQINVTLQALDPSAVTDEVLEGIGQKLAPVIQQNFDNNTQMAVKA